MVAGGSLDRVRLPEQSAGVRSVLLDGQLVSRLDRVLRSFGRREKLFAIVAQLGRRKPILLKPPGEPGGEDEPDSECPAPSWQRQPTRVTFEPDENQKVTFAIRGHAVDVVNDAEEDEGAE